MLRRRLTAVNLSYVAEIHRSHQLQRLHRLRRLLTAVNLSYIAEIHRLHRCLLLAACCLCLFSYLVAGWLLPACLLARLLLCWLLACFVLAPQLPVGSELRRSLEAVL